MILREDEKLAKAIIESRQDLEKEAEPVMAEKCWLQEGLKGGRVFLYQAKSLISNIGVRLF